MSANPTRSAAFALLSAVLERRRGLEEALDALPGGLQPRDKAAAHRIAAAVLRRLGSIDAVLEPYLRREPSPPALQALRIGVAMNFDHIAQGAPCARFCAGRHEGPLLRRSAEAPRAR